MGNVIMNKKDKIIMKLVHYLITVENYTPIVVNGVKDEVWLENSDGPYKIIRINSNYIHNDEQYNFDVFKTKNIMKQIKKKTMSFSINALNILLDINSDIKIVGVKNIDAIRIDSLRDVEKNVLLTKVFPDIKSRLLDSSDGLELVVNATKEITEKTERDNQLYEKTFKPKKVIVTQIIIALNLLVFFLAHAIIGDNIFDFAVYGPAIRGGEFYRLITGAFIHVDLWHLIMNMYSLSILGKQIESFVGRTKFIAIYLISAVCGSLMSMSFHNQYSIGASGAIFGLMGALVYFGYHYRLYLGQTLKQQIIPLIILNLMFSLFMPSIDLGAHVGGLFGGLFLTAALGIEGKSNNNDRFHGTMLSIIFIAFLIVLSIFIRK